MKDDIKTVSIEDQIRALLGDLITIGQGGVVAGSIPNSTKVVLIADTDFVKKSDRTLSSKGKTYVKLFASGPYKAESLPEIGRFQIGYFENVPEEDKVEKMAWRVKNPK